MRLPSSRFCVPFRSGSFYLNPTARDKAMGHDSFTRRLLPLEMKHVGRPCSLTTIGGSCHLSIIRKGPTSG